MSNLLMRIRQCAILPDITDILQHYWLCGYNIFDSVEKQTMIGCHTMIAVQVSLLAFNTSINVLVASVQKYTPVYDA